ncbi:MAG: hypothetical protein ACM3NT_01980 [Methylocystaceae bacterium]
MKSAKSYFNFQIFNDLLKRHWWFGFINLIVLFFGIPINFLLSTQRFSDITPEGLAALHKYCTSFFTVQGSVTTVVLAMLSAMVAGLIFFAYLHKKEQINFFHSQPVSRECLFTVRISAGIILFILPYLINLAIALLIAAISGLSSQVVWAAVIGQIGLILLTFSIIYVLVVLAGMLSGTVAAQSQMSIIIGFAPLLVYTSMIMLGQRFYDTFYSDYFFQKVIYYSPVTHLISIASGQAAISAVTCLIYVVLTLVILALALGLYRKRPSEGAGMSLVFPISRPLVKYICCYISAVMLGVFFDQLGGFSFMIFGFIAGLVLCSLFAEAQFNRDFKAMFKNMKGLACFGVAFALLVAAMAGDITGYDKYQPAPDKIKAVSFTWDDADVRPIYHNIRYDSQRDMKFLTFTSSLVKKDLWTIVNATLASGSYTHKKMITGRSADSVGMQPYSINTRNLTVVYELDSGRKIARRYNNVAVKPVKEQVQDLISSREYRSKHVIAQMGKNTPANIMIEPGNSLNPDYRISKSIMNREQITAVMAAIKADVTEAGETIDNQVVYIAACDSREFNARINIYENYRRTITLLNQLAAPSDLVPANELTNLTRLEIRPIENPEAKPLIIEQKPEIEQVIKVSRSYWGETMTMSDDFVISAPITAPPVGDTYTKEAAVKRESNWYFVIGKVPEFVKAGMK